MNRRRREKFSNLRNLLQPIQTCSNHLLLLSHFVLSALYGHLPFEMAVSKMWRFGIFLGKIDRRQSGSTVCLAALQFYWNSAQDSGRCWRHCFYMLVLASSLSPALISIHSFLALASAAAEWVVILVASSSMGMDHAECRVQRRNSEAGSRSRMNLWCWMWMPRRQDHDKEGQEGGDNKNDKHLLVVCCTHHLQSSMIMMQ